MKRRKFILSLVGVTAAGWSGAKLLVPKAGSATSPTQGLAKFSRQSWALGADIRLTVFHPDRAVAEAALNRAFIEIERVEQALSLFRPQSDLSRLNRDGMLTNPHPHLSEVLEAALVLSAQTEGAFDVSVQPLWELYSDTAQRGESPPAAALESALRLVDWRAIEVTASAIRLRQKGMALTFNGIAQGFAADRVAQSLRADGVAHALIDTGEIGTVGTHAEKDEWTIGLKHPRLDHAYLGLAHLRGRSLATSGDYETTFSADLRDHHLLDARTGRSPLDLASVSVIAPTAMQADALSTACFALGHKAGKQLAESLPEVDALFVTKSGELSQTAGFPFTAQASASAKRQDV